MKRLAGFLVLFFAATQAPAQFVPGPPARAMYCLNPSGVWTAIATGLSASVLPNTPPAASAYGIGTDGAWHGLQCDASGNLIVPGTNTCATTGCVLANPTTATTQSAGDNTTKVATDAFVLANVGGGGGSISGQTAGYAIEAASPTTATGPFPLDDSVTTANTITAHKAFAVDDGSGIGGGLDGLEGTAATPVAGHDKIYADATSHAMLLSENGGAFSPICTTANGFCAGSGNLASINSQTGPAITLQSTGATVTITTPSSNVINLEATGGGGTHQWSCQPGIGDGLNAITAGTYLQSTCKNTTGSTVTLTGLQCFTDNSGSSTMNAAGNTLGALLTGAVTCTSSFAAGTQSANVLLTNGDYIKFTFVADGTSKQATWVVTGTY